MMRHPSADNRQRAPSHLTQGDEASQAPGLTPSQALSGINLPMCYVERPGVTLHTASGTVVRPGPKIPLIPVDQLPEWVEVVGVPSKLSCQQAESLTSVGIIPMGDTYTVNITSSGRHILDSASPPIDPTAMSFASRSHDGSSSAGSRKSHSTDGRHVEKLLTIKSCAGRQMDEDSIRTSDSQMSPQHSPSPGLYERHKRSSTINTRLDSVYSVTHEKGLSVSRHATSRQQDRVPCTSSFVHGGSSEDYRLLPAYPPMRTTTTAMAAANAKGAEKQHNQKQYDHKIKLRTKKNAGHSPSAQTNSQGGSADKRCYQFLLHGVCVWGANCKFRHERPGEEYVHIDKNKDILLDFE